MQRVSTLHLLQDLPDPETPVTAFRGHIECCRSSPALGREMLSGGQPGERTETVDSEIPGVCSRWVPQINHERLGDKSPESRGLSSI